MFSVSWFFQGQAVQNNTVLQFNMYDTLSLTCKSTMDLWYYIPEEYAPGAPEGVNLELLIRPTFAITRGSSPPSDMYFDLNTSANYFLSVDDPITLIYSDWQGLQTGFENFIVLPGFQSFYTTEFFRYVNVGVLRPQDSGTYHCSASLIPDEMMTLDSEDYFEYPTWIFEGRTTSGGVTIMVNTKQDQARSIRAKSANLLTYTVALLGASKILF